MCYLLIANPFFSAFAFIFTAITSFIFISSKTILSANCVFIFARLLIASRFVAETAFGFLPPYRRCQVVCYFSLRQNIDNLLRKRPTLSHSKHI